MEELSVLKTAMQVHVDNFDVQKSAFNVFDSFLNATHSRITPEVVNAYLKTHSELFTMIQDLKLMDHVNNLLHCSNQEVAHLAIEHMWKFCLYGEYEGTPIPKLIIVLNT